MEEREMLLLDETLSLLQRNDDSPTPLIILDDQEPVRESGWSLQQTPPLEISVASCFPTTHLT
jgi:hypothetical protein